MDKRTSVYLRERRKLTGEWSANARIAAALVGLGLGALVPIQSVSQIVRSLSGLVIVEAGLWLWRFVYVAPKAMYFDALDRVRLSELEAEKAAQDCQTQLKTYTTNISTLSQEKAVLEARLERKQKDQEFADTLTERYNFAVIHIMNAPEVQKPHTELTPEDWIEWNRREKAWTMEVRGLLEAHGCKPQIVTHFWTIQSFAVNAYHRFGYVSHAISMFSERLDRLKSIINDYAETAILKT